MKEILSKKTLALILLLTTAFVFAVPPAHAQDVELLPNASPEDVKVETAPYEGQDYKVRTAQGGVAKWVFGALGDAVKILLFGNADADESVASWVGGHVIESLIGGLNVLLGGVEEEEGGGGGGGGVGSNPLAHGGAIGMMGGVIGGVYQDYPNLGTGDFFKNNLADNLLTGSAYATGMEDIKATRLNELWEKMRNISYVFMVIILIAMGFMVMLRARIDPRTTMTLSAALPKVATSLILIAFSLPIAGIIIDFSKVLTGLIDSVFGDIITSTPEIPEMVGVGIANIFKNFVWGTHIEVALGFGALGSVVELFIQLIIRVIAFAASIMIFWTLISRYASLLIGVVFAPFAFLWGALPGQEDTTSRWFRSYIVNALTFPGIYLVINIANWVVRVSTIPLPPAWETTTADISGLVALGILLTATKIPAILEDALEVAAPAGVARAGLAPGAVLKEVPLIKRFAK